MPLSVISLANLAYWIICPQVKKLLKLSWISLALQLTVMFLSLTNQEWMKETSQVCQRDLAVILASSAHRAVIIYLFM